MQRHPIKKAIILGSLAIATSAQAIVTFDYEIVHTGATPGGTPPWATLTIMNDGPNKVDMTLSHNASSASGQFISKLLLNVDPFITDLDIIENSPKITGAGFGQDAFADAGAGFDVEIQFEVSGAGGGVNRLKPGESVSWEITGTGVTENHFEAFSTGVPLLSLIHIQGIAGGESGKVTVVPEPATLLAVGAALSGLLVRRRTRV